MYKNIINAINANVWAIIPAKMEVIMNVLLPRLDGMAKVDYEAVTKQPINRTGKVVVLPIRGTMTQHGDMFSEVSGMVSTDRIGRQIEQLADDPSVKSIILDVDSPGGSVYGLEELTQKIRAATNKKRIISVANSLMASAAYYTGSAASKVYAAPGSQVGSIGTIAVHVDQSKAIEEAGLKYTFVTAGKYKALGNSSEPLSEDAMNYYQDQVNEYYEMFLQAVAKNRSTTKSKVKSEYGQGKVLSAKNALSTGMIDGIRTLDDVISMETRRTRR